MGRPKKIQTEEVSAEATVEAGTPSERVLVGTKGKFRLFQEGDSFVVLDDSNRLLSHEKDLESGMKLLEGLSR